MINLKGKTPYQAFLIIEETTNAKMPEEAKSVLRELVGEDGRLGDVILTKVNGEIGLEIALDNPERVKKGTALAKEIELINSDPELTALRKKYGEVEYNGGVGDSCACAICNLRRAEHGLDVTKDMLDGLTRDESEATAVAEYAKLGKTLPADRTVDAGLAKFKTLKADINKHMDEVKKKLLGDKRLDPILEAIFGNFTARESAPPDVLKKIELTTAEALSLTPGARKGFISLVGEDSEALKDFDRIVELLSKGVDVTYSESVEMKKLLPRLLDAVAIANR